jgi:hypothetical protein
MMAMQTPRWLLLATALTFASALGCGSDTPSPKPGGGDDDDGNSDNPASTDDDDGDDEDKPAAALDAGTGKKDAGSTTKPTGTDAGAGAGKDKDAGKAGSDSDAAASVDKDGGGSSPADGSVANPGMGAGAGSCGPEVTSSAAELGDTKKLGPWKPMHVEKTGPSGASWVYYPEGFGKDGLKHPVFQWGPGAGTGPSNYLDHLNLLASYGFVVISQPSTNSGKQALDWILKQNETTGSMWFGKLDPDRVARGGHSMGALQSMSEADDDRLKLTVLVCGGAGGGGGAAKIDYPSIFLGGKGESGTANFQGDYAEVKALSVFVTHSTADHISCARDNMGPWVAFMRWHLCGEEAKWKKEFMEGGTYGKTPWEPLKSKSL